MPRVHYVKKARKDNGVVKKGQPYYWWKFRFGGKRVSLTPPSRSQLTQSDKMSRIYEAEDSARAAIDSFTDHSSPEAVSELASSLREYAEAIREVGQDYEESRDNMPENLQSSYQAEEMQEKADAAETTAQSLEDIAEQLESLADDYHNGEYEPDDPEADEADEVSMDRFADEVAAALGNDFEEWPY